MPPLGELRECRFHGNGTPSPYPPSETMVMTYRAPINDMLLALNYGAGLQAALQAGHYGDFDGDVTAAVLEEAGNVHRSVGTLNQVAT